MKVRELLSDETKWTKKVYARNNNGIAVDVDDDDAVRWCLIGAIKTCTSSWREEDIVIQKVRDEINMFIEDWNDAPERTFAEVKALIDRLDI